MTGLMKVTGKLGLARILFILGDYVIRGSIAEIYHPASLNYWKGRFTDVTLGKQGSKFVAGAFFATDDSSVPNHIVAHGCIMSFTALNEWETIKCFKKTQPIEVFNDTVNEPCRWWSFGPLTEFN